MMEMMVLVMEMMIISLLGFGACRDLRDKPKFFENGFRMENLLRFRVGNIIG